MTECDNCGRETGIRRHKLEDENGEEYILGFCCSDRVEIAGIHANSRRASGLKSTAVGSPAKTFVNARDLLTHYAERFEGVILHNRDYKSLLETHDTPPSHKERGDVLWYFDPPYPDAKEHYYTEGSGFDHAEFAEVLGELEGRFIVSYEGLPDPVADLVDEQGLHVVKKEVSRPGTNNGEDGARKVYERLVMNYDPAEVPRFVDRSQQTLGEEWGEA